MTRGSTAPQAAELLQIRRFIVAWAVLVVLGASPLSARQHSESLPVDAKDLLAIPRIEEPLVLDGRRDKEVWEAIEPLPAVMMIPDFGEEPTERTEFRIAYDGEYLYFSCRAYDSDPSGIQISSLSRNEAGWTSDRCMIYLDTLNDEENSLGFITTPAGVRTDVAHRNDGVVWNMDWDTYWDVEVVRDEEGWHAEFRIPFSSLLFQTDEDGRVVMGLSMLRSIPRKNERHIYPEIPPRWGNFSHTKPTQMRKVVFEDLQEVKPVHITPYSLLGTSYSHALDGVEAEYERHSTAVGEIGGDLKYGITSNLTLDLTVNTDFAQVEADDQRLNLTRFSLFFPEKRRFFQEREAAFEYSLGDQERLFHSRRVGLAEGEPVRIYGGARLVGRVGEWDVGLLNMHTAESELLPSENQGVVRVRRRVWNPYSYVGGIVTSRIASAGRYNLVYGLDGIFRIAGDDYLTLNLAQSFEDDEASMGSGGNPFNRGLLRLNWERRGEDELTYLLDLVRAGEAFEPGMGFLRRRDFLKGDAEIGYGRRLGSESSLLRYAMSLSGTVFRRNSDRTVETVEVTPTAEVETRGGNRLIFSLDGRYENLETGFFLPEGTSVPGGEVYRFVSGRLQYRSSMGSLSGINASLEGGGFYDGRRASASLGPNWNPSIHLSMNTSYGLEYVEFPERNESFTAHVVRMRTDFQLSTVTSGMVFVQYNSAHRAVIANLRLRYNPREGNDFYLVWDEGLVTDRHSFDPVRPFSSERSLVLKYSHTLSLGL